MYKSLLDATFSSLPPCEDEYGYEELKKLLMLPFFSDAFKEALESFDEGTMSFLLASFQQQAVCPISGLCFAGIILVDKLPAFPREFMDILMEQLQAAFNLALLGDAFDNIQLTLAVLRLFYYLCYNSLPIFFLQEISLPRHSLSDVFAWLANPSISRKEFRYLLGIHVGGT